MNAFYLRGLLLSWLWIPCLAISQQVAVEVLETAFTYQGLQSFWCIDGSGAIRLSHLATQGKLSNRLDLRLWERVIPMQTDLDPDRPYALRIRRFALNPAGSKAKLAFTYHGRVRARLTLRKEQGVWHVTRAWIRQKRPCDPTRQGSRFVWQF